MSTETPDDDDSSAPSITDEEGTTKEDEALPVEWEDLPPAKQRVAKAIGHIHGLGVFERPDVLKEARDSETLEEVVDDVDKTLTSLKYPSHLNELGEYGYDVKEYQGGENPIILYLEYEEERDDHEVAPYGRSSELHDLVFQILDKEGLSESALGDVDMDDFNAVRDAVNRALRRTVLVTVSEASQYRFTEEGYEIIKEKIEEEREEE